MSSSEGAAQPTEAIAAELVSRFNEAVDTGRLDLIDDHSLGSVFASAIRILAAKAQQGEAPCTFSGNNTISATDAVIACTAILESVDLAVFELAAWQAVSNIGSRRVATATITERDHDRHGR
jgi:hypothetical protein